MFSEKSDKNDVSTNSEVDKNDEKNLFPSSKHDKCISQLFEYPKNTQNVEKTSFSKLSKFFKIDSNQVWRVSKCPPGTGDASTYPQICFTMRITLYFQKTVTGKKGPFSPPSKVLPYNSTRSF